jgi:hypothetical protein
MRRDVFIANDSGGFSVVAADAVDDIIADARSDDMRFVTGHKALLLELYGDDSMPVRIVVDEPLRPDEEAQWLARASWRLDTSDGRLIVMGGFDPDILSDWKEKTDGAVDGHGVGVLDAAPGSWRVDVYAHVGSMNGRAILDEAGEKIGRAFRRSHGDRAFPLWLARALELSGDDDPGHEDLWKDLRASMAGGRVQVETDGGDAIGFLIHVTPLTGAIGEPPESGWFDRTANARVPALFPLGLRSEVPDSELRAFCDRLLGREPPVAPRPIAEGIVEIIESWPGNPLKPIPGGPPIEIPAAAAYLLYWIAALGADSPPRFELWVEAKGPWKAPESTPDFAVISKGPVKAIGPVPNTGGWHAWWTARDVAGTLTGVPDGSTMDLAMAPRLDHNPEINPLAGRALYSGTVAAGSWQLKEASPAVSREALDAALTFVRGVVVHGRIHVRPGPEREAFDAAAAIHSPEEGSLVWNGDVVELRESDERVVLILASPVFRVRFGTVWEVDPVDS